MNHSSCLLVLFVFLILFPSCDKNKDENPFGSYTNSVFIINEGPFQSGSGAISAYDRESSKVKHDIFEDANGKPLGNIVQSMAVHDGRGYIVVHKANKIEVVNLEDFKSVATIDGIELPRYFIGCNKAKGYVSCWDSTVKVIDLRDFSVDLSIPTGAGPDEMLIAGEKLFVINSGGFGVGNTVTVIDTATEQVVRNITVGDRPASIQMDSYGTIWVLCSGKGWNGFPDPSDTPARLISFSPDTYEILGDSWFFETDKHPDNIVINENGNLLYYNHPEGIYSFSIAQGLFNPEPLIPSNKMYYGLGYDESREMIYAADPLDYAQNGWVFRFDAYNGTKVDSIPAGLIPNGFCFN